MAADAAMAAAATTASCAPQDVCTRLSALLEERAFQEIATVLVTELDDVRNPHVVNWCAAHGHGAGHALPLYYATRNVLKWRSSGCVPTTHELFHALTCAVVLLVRVGQDVAACRLDLAKSGREFVFLAVRAKLWSWVSAWRTGALPPVPDVVAAVDAWFGAHAAPTLPLPVWANAFNVSWPTASTFYWGTPTPTDVTAFQRSCTVADTRAVVLAKALAALRGARTWEAVFALPTAIMG